MVIDWNLKKTIIKLKFPDFEECNNVGERKIRANSAKVGPKENNYGIQNQNASLQPELVGQ